METLLGLIIGLALGGVGVWTTIKSQIQTLNSQKQASEEKTSIYCSQRDALDRDNREKNAKIDILENSLSRKEDELRSNLERVSIANAKLEQISDLEARLETEISVNQNYTDKIASHREKISQQATEIKNFEQRIGELKNELHQAVLNKNVARKEIEIEIANHKSAEANAKEAQLIELRQELINEKEKNKNLQSQIEKLREQLASLETKSEEEQNSAQEEINLLRNAVRNLADTLSRKKDELRSNLERVSIANAKLEQISDLETRLETERSANQNYTDKIASHKEKISQQAIEIKNFEQRIGELKNELHQAVLNKNVARKEIEIEIANHKGAEANAKEEQLIELRQELINEKEKNKNLQSQIEKLREQLASLETKSEEEQNSAQEEIDLLRNAVRNLADTFQDLSANAFQNDSQQFIEVAKETFDNIHQNSHQQINNLVSPLNNSLEQFRQQIEKFNL